MRPIQVYDGDGEKIGDGHPGFTFVTAIQKHEGHRHGPLYNMHEHTCLADAIDDLRVLANDGNLAGVLAASLVSSIRSDAKRWMTSVKRGEVSADDLRHAKQFSIDTGDGHSVSLMVMFD